MSISSVSSFSNLPRPDLAQMREKLFQQADTDGSGTISKDEWTTARKNAPKPPDAPEGSSAPSADDGFTKIDSNGDGEITPAEMEAADKAREAEMQAKSSPSGTGGIGSFSGSTDLMQSLFETLQTDDSGSSSTTAAATDTESTKQELIKTLLTQLQEKNQQYMANWAHKSGSGISLFGTTV